MKKTSKLLGFNCELELAKEIEARAQGEGKTTSEYIRDVLYGDLGDAYENDESKVAGSDADLV
jgi:hypothetical protein